MVTQADQQAVAIGLPRRRHYARVARDDLPMLVPASAGRVTHPTRLALRHGRTRRVNRSRTTVATGKILDMVNISERPVEADDRAVPGFWEGDLIIGKGGKSQIATLVERTSRYVMLIRIPYDRTTQRVAALLAQKMETLPDFLRNSVTWDQGKEMAGARELHDEDRNRRLFLRSTRTLATRHQRKHQWPPAPILPQRNRPVGLHTSRNSTQSPTNSTTAHDRHSTGSNPPKSSTNSWSRGWWCTHHLTPRIYPENAGRPSPQICFARVVSRGGAAARLDAELVEPSPGRGLGQRLVPVLAMLGKPGPDPPQIHRNPRDPG